MSVEFFAYSGDSSDVAIDDLLSGCRQRGYDCQVLRGGQLLIATGPLASDDVIVGWRPSFFFGNRAAQEAAASCNWEAINKLQKRNAMGALELEIWSEPSKYNNPDELRELGETLGAEYVRYRKESKVRWYVRLAAGRNSLSVELADAVLRALLEQRGGMLDEPQSGEYEVIRRK